MAGALTRIQLFDPIIDLLICNFHTFFLRFRQDQLVFDQLAD